jgi:hypothetical protein
MRAPPAAVPGLIACAGLDLMRGPIVATPPVPAGCSSFGTDAQLVATGR